MSSIPWRDIAIVFLTNVPMCDDFSALIVVVDLFSKIILLVPLRQKIEAVDITAAFFQAIEDTWSPIYHY